MNSICQIILGSVLAFAGGLWDWFSRLRTTINNSYILNRMVNDPGYSQWAKNEIKKQVEKLKDMRSEIPRLLNKHAI